MRIPSVALAGPLGLLIALGALPGSSSPAWAAIASPSPGCTQMNSAMYDAQYTSMQLSAVFGYTFAAGEQLQVSAGSPSAGTSLTASLQVTSASTVTRSTSVPGSVTYTLTEDLDDPTTDFVAWSVSGTGGTVNATWTVTCLAAAAPTPEAAEVSEPELIQQFARHAASGCSEASESVLSWGSEIPGGWGASWAQWPNDGRGGFVCTRTLHRRGGVWITR